MSDSQPGHTAELGSLPNQQRPVSGPPANRLAIPVLSSPAHPQQEPWGDASEAEQHAHPQQEQWGDASEAEQHDTQA